MKSLWVVNKCCGAMHEHIYGKKSTGGLWLDVAISEAKQANDDTIIVVNVEKIKDVRFFQDGNTKYYTIPGEPNAKYDYAGVEAKKHWGKIVSNEKPDNIVLWGSEFPYGLAAIDAAPTLPTYIYIQGILDSIAKYYTAGMSKKELKYAWTFRDVIKGDSILQTQKDFERRAEYEKKIIQRAKHVIIENRWSLAYLKKICPDATAHIQYLQISDDFYASHWKEDGYDEHVIMCPAAYYPIKGLHMLLRALAIVKEQYPDVKLIIPGLPLNTGATIHDRLRRKGYDKFISHLIAQLGLQKNVSYIGFLTATEMAQRMSRANCFVVCSAIENHSSTLKEAMAVAVPCIASYVGGIPEYAEDGKNALLYRYEDYEVAAQHILNVFEQKELRMRLSEEAQKTMSTFDKCKSGYWGLRQIVAGVQS